MKAELKEYFWDLVNGKDRGILGRILVGVLFLFQGSFLLWSGSLSFVPGTDSGLRGK